MKRVIIVKPEEKTINVADCTPHFPYVAVSVSGCVFLVGVRVSETFLWYWVNLDQRYTSASFYTVSAAIASQHDHGWMIYQFENVAEMLEELPKLLKEDKSNGIKIEPGTFRGCKSDGFKVEGSFVIEPDTFNGEVSPSTKGR